MHSLYMHNDCIQITKLPYTTKHSRVKIFVVYQQCLLLRADFKNATLLLGMQQRDKGLNL